MKWAPHLLAAFHLFCYIIAASFIVANWGERLTTKEWALIVCGGIAVPSLTIVFSSGHSSNPDDDQRE